MSKMAAQVLVGCCWATFFFSTSVFAATTGKHATPISTCCPPGHFLAIEDSQESRQGPDGVWTSEEVKAGEQGPIYDAIFTKSYLADKWYRWTAGVVSYNSGDELIQEKTVLDRRRLPYIDRHQHISRVFCVPDKNDLPNIDGLSGSALPSPPYWRDEISVEIRVLAEDQVLQSKGLISLLNVCIFHFFPPRVPSPFLPRWTSRVGHHCTWRRWADQHSETNCSDFQATQAGTPGRNPMAGDLAGTTSPLSCGSTRLDRWLDAIWT